MLRKKSKFYVSCLVLVSLFVLPIAPTLADDIQSPIGMPNMEDLIKQKITEEMQRQQKIQVPENQSDGVSQIGDQSELIKRAMEGNIPVGDNFDFSKLPQIEKMPQGAPDMSFMGQKVSGESAGGSVARLVSAFDQIQEQLMKAESGVNEIKGGGIKTDQIDGTVKTARDYYNKAKSAFEAQDYQAAGDNLSKIQGLSLDQKFSSFQDTAVSTDLINNIRARMQSALKNLDSLKGADVGDIIEVKSKLNASLYDLDNAQKLLKQGKKKEAAQILKDLRESSPENGAADLSGKFGALGKDQLDKILNQISDGLARAKNGIAKAEANDIEINSFEKEALDKGEVFYQKAKSEYDAEKYTDVMMTLQEFKNLNLEEVFSNFKERSLPKEKLNYFIGQMADGLKALELTIAHAKDYGMDTAPLEIILEQFKVIYAKANDANKAGDREAFLQYADELDGLNVREKVDTYIRKMATNQIKDLVSEGIINVTNASGVFKKIVDTLTGKQDVTSLKLLLIAVDENIQRAQAFYDQGDYMAGGKALDGSVNNLLSLRNILTDTGNKISDDLNKQITNLIKSGQSAGNFSNVSSDKKSKVEDILKGIPTNDLTEMQGVFMQFNPELMTRVIAQREKDKKFIDNIIRDVTPLIREKDRAAMLEGKLNLIDESRAADKTIAGLNKIVGVQKSSIKDFALIKDQIKFYNFPTAIAEKLDQEMENFNDGVQSGKINDADQIKSYINILKQDVTKSVQAATEEKYKQGLIPAKNINDTDVAFNDIQYLKKDGAVSTDKRGNINLKQKMDAIKINNMIGKTLDERFTVYKKNGNVTVADTLKSVAKAYGVADPAKLKDQKAITDFSKKIGVEFKVQDLNKTITFDVAASIIAKADKRWGNQ